MPKKNWTRILIESLFIVAKKTKNWKQPRFLSAAEWINKLCCIHAMEHYVVMNWHYSDLLLGVAQFTHSPSCCPSGSTLMLLVTASSRWHKEDLGIPSTGNSGLRTSHRLAESFSELFCSVRLFLPVLPSSSPSQVSDPHDNLKALPTFPVPLSLSLTSISLNKSFTHLILSFCLLLRESILTQSVTNGN